MRVSAESIETAALKWTKHFPSIQIEGRTFCFDPSLSVVFFKNGGYWIACNADFDIDAMSTSLDGAAAAFGIEILSLWDNIAAEKDDKLTTDAQILKKNLLKRIKESV